MTSAGLAKISCHARPQPFQRTSRDAMFCCGAPDGGVDHSEVAAGPPEPAAVGVPHMTYLPVAGRGELVRLIAAAGGVQLTESTAMQDGEAKDAYLSPEGLPILRHGDLKMSQSLAIENYVAALSPKFGGLSPKQSAVDQMYGGIKEELLANCVKAIFRTRKADPQQATQDITALFDKWFTILEAKVPEDGFIHGLEFPTPADLVMVNLTRAYMPFGAAAKHAGYDFSKFPKVMALADRAAKTEAVAAYLENSQYTTANPLNV